MKTAPWPTPRQRHFAAFASCVVWLASLGLAWSCVHGGGGGSRPSGSGLFGGDGEEAGAVGGAFLWRVTSPTPGGGGEGGPTASSSWLFGTVHVGFEAEKDLAPHVWKAFRASPCFVMESDPTAMSPTEIVSLSRLPEGQQLERQLKPEAWAKVKSRLSGALPPQLLANSAPWFVTLLYLQAIAPDAGEPMDGIFHSRAQDLEKRTEYLEDWREAMSAFASVTGAEDLEDLALHEEKALREIEIMLEAYKSGDEAKLISVMSDINDDTPNGDAKLRVLLDERNGKWMPRLTDTLARAPSGGCFVAVGAGHLIGKNNLRDQLTARGYKISRASAADVAAAASGASL